MKGRSLQVLIAMMVTIAGGAERPAAAGQRPGVPAQVGRSAAVPSQRIVDRKSGLVVRVTQRGQNEIAIEVADDVVAIRKLMTPTGVVTSLTSNNLNKEKVAISVDSGQLTLTTPFGVWHASRSTPSSFAQLNKALAASSVVRSAAGLLGRLGLDLDSPVGHSLLLTRAFLQNAIGDDSGRRAIAQWVQNTSQRLHVTRVALQDDGPGWCWDQYAREAIAAYDEYASCLNGLQWWQILASEECYAIYFLRAEGAFWWWVKCIGVH